MCDGSNSAAYLANMSVEEQRGREYMQALGASFEEPALRRPCRVNWCCPVADLGCPGRRGAILCPEVNGSDAVSCAAAFCPEALEIFDSARLFRQGASSAEVAQCEWNCRKHPFFCQALRETESNRAKLVKISIKA